MVGGRRVAIDESQSQGGVTAVGTTDKVDLGGSAVGGDRAGTSATVTPLWSYPCSSHTEARDTAEGFSSASSDSLGFEGHHGQAGSTAQICGL